MILFAQGASACITASKWPQNSSLNIPNLYGWNRLKTQDFISNLLFYFIRSRSLTLPAAYQFASIFLARDAMRKRGTSCLPDFVCLSVRRTLYQNIDIIIPFSRPSSPIILVTLAHPALQNSKKNSSAGIWKNSQFFGQFLAISWKWYNIGSWLLMITNRKSQVADRSISVPMTLSDLERQNASGPIFPAELSSYACTVRPRTIKFGMVALWGGACFGRSAAQMHCEVC